MSFQTEILGLSLAYTALGVLLLIAVTRTPLRWSTKAILIGVTSAFYIVAFFRIQGLLGWPSSAPLPPRFELVWSHVVEASADEAGAIFLWAAELNGANVPNTTPRVYQLPYSAALARKIAKAQAEIANGHPQIGRPTDFGLGGGSASADGMTPTRGGGPGGDPSGGGTLDLKYLGGGGPSIDFAPLPQPSLPPKEAP
jgi:hypothetical protein